MGFPRDLQHHIEEMFGMTMKKAAEFTGFARFKPKFKHGVAGLTADLTAEEWDAFLLSADVAGGSISATLTAFAGGGIGSATAITKQFTNVSTVATAGDSVKLPVATPGLTRVIRNSGAAALAVFPQSGSVINALSASASITIQPLQTMTFTATTTTAWKTDTGLSEGVQTFTGVKTFGSSPVVPAAGVVFGSTTISETEAGFLDGVTAGTFTASKAVVLSAGGLADGVRLGGRLSSLTADGASLANTSEATFPSGTVTIPANSLAAGDVLRFRACIEITAVDGTDSFRGRMHIGSLGGAILADTGAIGSVILGDVVIIEGTIDVRTIGATADMRGFSTIHGLLAATGFGSGAAPTTLLSGFTRDSTGALDMTVTGQFGGAGNTASLRSFTVWKN